ncbi:MAG: class I SAM-dependent methyltransferase [Planctomycetota bacterium]
MHRIYDHPRYYDLAFSYRDIADEVDTVEQAWWRFAAGPLNTVCELACGHAPHADAFAERGVHYIGVDIAPTMLGEAAARHPRAGFIQADVADFALPEPVDLLCVFLGSLYLADREALDRHLDHASAALRPGGLYFMDWCVLFDDPTELRDHWTASRGPVQLKCDFHAEPANGGCFTEILTLAVDDDGHRFHLEERTTQFAITEGELLAALQRNGRFALVGSWNAWDLSRPLPEPACQVERPITVLRRREAPTTPDAVRPRERRP